MKYPTPGPYSIPLWVNLKCVALLWQSFQTQIFFQKLVEASKLVLKEIELLFEAPRLISLASP